MQYLKKKKRMVANQHCAEDIYNLPWLPGRLLHLWMKGSIWKYVNTHLHCSISLLVLLIS